jgi:hypothetical protein
MFGRAKWLARGATTPMARFHRGLYPHQVDGSLTGTRLNNLRSPLHVGRVGVRLTDPRSLDVAGRGLIGAGMQRA